MTDIIIGFDVEDYVNPAGAEGVYRCAKLLTDNGVTGSFAVVAKCAQALIQWGRQDAIDAMKSHEICYHSLDHSKHPCITEYTDIEDYDEAKARFLKNETKGFSIVKDLLEVNEMHCSVPPGWCYSYVGNYTYVEMGMPVYAGGFVLDQKRDRALHFCNAVNLNYTVELDELLTKYNKEQVDEMLYSVTKGKDIAVLFHHPQRSYVCEFWDVMNYKGTNTPESQWKLATPRTYEETEKFYENFDYLIKKIKSDKENFRFVTYKDIYNEHCKDKRVIRKEDIPSINAQISDMLFPVTLPDSYCLSDILLGCRDLLLGKSEHKCGTVYGFLEYPFSISEPVTVTAQAMKESASQIGDGFLPTQITVGDKVLGTADWLRAALKILSGNEETTVYPAPWQIDLDQFPRYRDFTYDNKIWVIHSEDMKGDILHKRIRLQSWTIRLPKATPRLVFD